MTDAQWKLAASCLLRDVGKILPQDRDLKHNQRAVKFLETVGFMDLEELVKYSDVKALEEASLPEDSLAYIAWIADRIANDASEANEESDSLRGRPLMSLFNHLNDNDGQQAYPVKISSLNGFIAYPEEVSVDAVPEAVPDADYDDIVTSLKDRLSKLTNHSINGLKEILEDLWSQIPSWITVTDSSDISMYDRAKLRAGMACAIHEYCQANKIEDYKQLTEQVTEFETRKTFLIYSMDVSGIQDFIYTIPSSGALKNLRARSFYLEIMMEHLIDELLDSLGHSRVNLIYAGGGHAYLLLANTPDTKNKIETFEKDNNQWFLKYFKNALYIAGGYTECSAKDLRNEPQGAYKELFKNISTQLGAKKIHRYSAEEIKSLNDEKPEQSERECSVCHRMDRLSVVDKCDICTGLEAFSNSILMESFFIITNETIKDEGIQDLPLPVKDLPLPREKHLRAVSEVRFRNIIKKSDSGFVRGYSKNRSAVDGIPLTRLWVGDYASEQTFEELAQASQGIKRIAVLRVDVDNLGQAFVSGFENPRDGDRYVSLTRTSAFSRKLSMFFKYHINYLLENGKYFLDASREEKRRHAAVVYSGGDDAFIVGSWDDVIGFTVDLHESLKKYTQGTLSISGGIGIYPPKFPISAMARQSGSLESTAKNVDGKKAVALFSKDHTYPLDCFHNDVLNEKLKVIQSFLDSSPDRGNSFMYNLFYLMINRQKKINLPRFAYTISRLRPEEKASQTGKDEYEVFSEKLYQWMTCANDSQQAITAMQLYAYLTRTEKK